jgi:hypothetical protein
VKGGRPLPGPRAPVVPEHRRGSASMHAAS